MSKVGCKVLCPIDRINEGGKLGAVRYEGVLVGYAEESSCVRVWNPKKERKVLNVGGVSFDETVGKSWWLGSQPGVVERMEPFPDEEGEVPDDGEVPIAAGDGPSRPPPPPPPPPPFSPPCWRFLRAC